MTLLMLKVMEIMTLKLLHHCMNMVRMGGQWFIVTWIMKLDVPKAVSMRSYLEVTYQT